MVVEMINGRRVGVSRSGAGAPMLMLHPALAHRGALAPLMAALEGPRFTSFDLPGHGQSEFDQSEDIQAQAVETAVFLLEQADRPSDIFGHSFGATVALKLALLRPELVQSLSLYEPVYFSLLSKVDPAAYAAEAAASKAFSDASAAGDWPAAASAFLARWSIEGFGTLPPAQKAYILQTIPLITASERSIIDPETGEGIRQGLAELQPPLLLIEGRESPEVTAAINTVITNSSPNTQRHCLTGAGHMGPLTHVGSVANRVLAHMAEFGPA